MTPAYQKRVAREIENFNNEKNFNKYSKEIVKFFKECYVNTYFCDDENNKNMHLQIFDKNDVLVNLNVPNEYPFKQYNISFTNINFKNKNNTYNRNLYLLNEKKHKIYDANILSFFYKIQYCIQPRFLNLNNNQCFCCSSITCYSHWSPALTFENILLEYLEFNFINKYNKPYNYLYIQNTYNYLFEIYFNKLPIELLDKIFGYLI